MTANDFTDIFAVPGENHIIDTVHPTTDRSTINGETLEQIRLRYPNAERMKWEDWRQEQITRQNTPVRWIRVTEREYIDMYEVLPPVCFSSSGFMVGEPHDHSHETGAPRFQAYIVRGSHYYRQHFRSSRPLTVKEYRDLTHAR